MRCGAVRCGAGQAAGGPQRATCSWVCSWCGSSEARVGHALQHPALPAPQLPCSTAASPTAARPPAPARLVPRLEVHLVLLAVRHLLALLVHARGGAEDVLLQLRAHGVQHQLRLLRLAPVDVVHHCGRAAAHPGPGLGSEGRPRQSRPRPPAAACTCRSQALALHAAPRGAAHPRSPCWPGAASGPRRRCGRTQCASRCWQTSRRRRLQRPVAWRGREAEDDMCRRRRSGSGAGACSTSTTSSAAAASCSMRKQRPAHIHTSTQA